MPHSKFKIHIIYIIQKHINIAFFLELSFFFYWNTLFFHFFQRTTIHFIRQLTHFTLISYNHWKSLIFFFDGISCECWLKPYLEIPECQTFHDHLLFNRKIYSLCIHLLFSLHLNQNKISYSTQFYFKFQIQSKLSLKSVFQDQIDFFKL